MTVAGADHTANIDALECVRQFLQAEQRRDLIRYRARLHDDLVVRVGDAIVVLGADDAALLATREWALAPDAHRTVDDIGVASGMVTISFRMTDGVVPGAGTISPHIAGHSIYEVQDGKIIRIWHHVTAGE